MKPPAPTAGHRLWAAVLIGWQKWLPIIIIILLSQGSIAVLFSFDAEMTPVNPVVREGDTLVANCTFKETYTGASNASDLFIKVGGKVVPKDNIRVLNSQTAQVTLRNVTRDMTSHSTISMVCYLNRTGTSPKMQGGLVIAVGVPPVKPVITPEDCIVYNWENMSCSWHPSDQRWKNVTNLHTETTLSWTVLLEGEKTTFYKCPYQPLRSEYTEKHKLNMCHWKRLDGADSFKPNLKYYVIVTAHNAFGNASSDVVTIDTRLLVLPNPVKNLRMVNQTANSITVSWNRPSESLSPVIYKLRYSSHWNNQMIMVDTTESVYTLNRLIPNTNYTIQVMVKPAEGGYWSDVQELMTSTLPDVPKTNPIVAPGGFVINSCGNDCQNITIFWKLVPHDEWHGAQFHYRVTIDQNCQTTRRYQTPNALNVPPHQHSVSVLADVHCSQIFEVQSENEHGYAEQIPTTIEVNSLDSMPPGQSEIIANALNDTSVNIHWDGQVNYETEAMAFWCKGSYLDKKCQGPLSWMPVPPQQSEVMVNLAEGVDYRNYLFGRAIINEGHTSGIQWSDCVFDNRTWSPPPQGNVSTYDTPGSLLVQWNSHQDCQKQRGYIINYLIYYCPVCDKKCCTDSERSVTTPRTASHYIIQDLKHRQQYLVRIKSVTAAGVSREFSEKLYSTTNGHWFHGYAAVLMVIGVVVASVLVLAGIVTVIIRTSKLYSWFENLPIKTPEGGLGPTVSTSSELALSGKDYCDYSPTTDDPWPKVPFSTQPSVDSNTDSGHGSISEQNLLQNRRSSSLSEESELDEVFVPSDDMKTQNGYLTVTMLDKVTMSDNGYLKPIPSEAVKENGYLKRDAFRTCDHRLANCPALPCVQEEGSTSSVTSNHGNSGQSQDAGSVENPGYRVVDIILNKQKSSVA